MNILDQEKQNNGMMIKNGVEEIQYHTLDIDIYMVWEVS